MTKTPRHFVTETKEEVKESRRIELDERPADAEFAGNGFRRRYEVKVGDGAPIRFAAQADPQESTLDSLTEEQYRLLEEVAHVVRPAPPRTWTSRSARAGSGLNSGCRSALIALTLGIAETFLGHWFSRSK